MPQTARKTAPDETHLIMGTIVAISGQHIAVTTENGTVMATRAVGCLVAPVPGDFVLVAHAQPQAFVLSVLSRNNADQDTELDTPGNMTIRARGDVHVLADGDMNAIAGQTMSLSGQTAEARFGDATLWITSLRLTAKLVSTVASTVEHVMGTLTQRLKNSVRLVEEHEEVQSSSSRYLVENTLTMHSKNAVHVAEEVAKIDAGQVHLG